MASESLSRGTLKLRFEAARLAETLAERRVRIVFAESCTGGLIAATLAEVPGISAWLCGSAVVYQIETKAEWLGVSREYLKRPGPVSRVVAEAMAVGALERTPQAELAASVTGHLGPQAPPRQDGLFFAAVAHRDEMGRTCCLRVVRHVLREDVPAGRDSLRVRRQRAAAAFVLRLARTTILGRR